MKNIHIEHPEDMILTGDLSVVELLYNFDQVSVKMDGAPAIVWGKDPATGTFFVGTKAVFNKKKIRIAHSHEEIDEHYAEEVADILHACFNFLPRTDSILQGDFIGWGNDRTFTPNTITYSFPEFVTQKIIIAPHTEYFAENDLRDAVAKPFTELLEDNQKVKWVQPSVDYVKYDDEAPTFKTENVKFLDERTAACCKKIINAFIREGKLLTYEMLTLIFDCPRLADLYLILIEMKEDLIDSFIITDCPTASIQGLKVKQEGFVIHGQNGMQTKLVDREVFAKANFTMPKRWTT
tara:strand:+ start:1655 stop:2536 length:882 start_codon:yes stop_codon:yes gene_type:complete